GSPPCADAKARDLGKDVASAMLQRRTARACARESFDAGVARREASRYHSALNLRQDKDFRSMAQRFSRAWPVLLIAVCIVAALGSGCWDVGSLGGLFGAPAGGGGSAGGNPGIGGGLTLRDLFVNARILKDPPKVVLSSPASGASDVSVQSP